VTPAISVIVPCHNHGRYLADALDSALGQSFDDLEVVVVDDGSTDETPDVVGRYLSDRRVHYYRIGHVGASAARNLGLRMARAPLVAFLDADDLWMEHKLERQLAVLASDSGLGVVYARRLVIDPEGRQLTGAQPALHRGQVLEAMFRTNFVCFSSALVRRPVFEDVGMFDESLRLAVDYEFWLRAATRYRFDYVDEPLVKYRTGHASLSRRDEERLATAEHIMTRFLNERGGRALLRPGAVRLAFAETYYHRGLLRRRQSRLGALAWFVRALARCPGYGPAWRGLASLPLPEVARRGWRRLLGRTADWSVRAPAAAPTGIPALPGRRPETCTPRN
jgi:glycosyltransferase involved in cell wall biosynthesis